MTKSGHLHPLERDHSERFPDIPTLVQECYAGVSTLAEVATMISEIVFVRPAGGDEPRRAPIVIENAAKEAVDNAA